MQSVIPDHVRYAEHYWEMSLRNHGQRIVHVGNIFSGLFCPIQRENKIPPQIRKPRREKHIVETKRKTWRDDPYLRARQKQWTEKLKKTKKIPHEITLEEASDLAVVGRDLFEWAAESSAAYIDRLEAERKKPVGEELREIVVRTEVMVEEEAEQPTLVCLGPRELTFISSIAQPVYASLRLENRGSTVVYYEWRRVTRHAAEYDDCAYNVSKVGALSRDVVFFCLNPRGSLSPRHSEEASFVFQSKVSGQFADEWELVVAPLTKTDVWKIALRGIVTPTEDQAHLRAAVDVEFVTQLSHSGVKQLVVDDVVAMVRTPNETRRQRRRQREEEAFGIASTPRNLYYTLDRYEALATLWLEASQFISELARPASSEVVEVNVANEALSLVQQAWDGDVDTIRRVLDGVEFRASSREEDEPCEATQAKKEPEEQGEDENEYDEDEDEKTEWPELTVEKQDPTLTDPRAVRLRALEARWRCLVCEAATRNEVTISKTPDLTAVALALAAAERTAGLSDTPAPMVNDEAWASLLEGVQLDEGNEPEVVAANNVEANGGSGEAAYRAGAVAAVMHILTTLEVHTPLSRFCQERSVSLSHVAVARATDVEGRVVLFQANLDICFELEERVWSLGDGAEQRIDQTARSLLAFLPILEDNNKRKTEPVVNVGPPRAVVLITEITSDEQRPSSVLLVDALKTSAAGGRYLVEFCGSVTSLEERLATLDNASSLVPLLVLEARNSEHLLCPPRPATEMPPLARLKNVDRFAGACLKNHLNVAARLLSCDRPLVIVLGDTERHAFGTKKNGLVARAGELDFWIDHADEILLAGRLALECLAALGVQTGKHDIDVAVLPIASKLLAKATRNDVHLQLPTDFATGNLLVDKTGVVGGGGIEIDEDDSADEDGDEVVEAEEEDDDEDPAAGYDYDGDVGDAVVKSGGIPADAYALDLGPARDPLPDELMLDAELRARAAEMEDEEDEDEDEEEEEEEEESDD
ncbi:hypothetical protein CTAYLR_002173 [Chrysophaeum taylorii]|uniref:phosphoglycerate kinase n=1 Tax=Chrysophaeum taylorii TaxID=2483200 RepID=A0AAD7XRN7_9STRA|nr:hypothetical protein CTAYLR_002173 [Chrysophaeum taylorii]